MKVDGRPRLPYTVGMAHYRYPGAQPFSTAQEHIFFGRERDVEALYRQIRLQPLVVLHAKSGLGKSSLLQAGIVPQVLHDGKYCPVHIRFNAFNPAGEEVRLPLDTAREPRWHEVFDRQQQHQSNAKPR